ncbi:MAG: hypothetical protein AB1634_07255, partial [Thermodesulfobacteriota bacterium]
MDRKRVATGLALAAGWVGLLCLGPRWLQLAVLLAGGGLGLAE